MTKFMQLAGGRSPSLSISRLNEVHVVPEFSISVIILAASLVIVIYAWNFKNHLR
jgi:hypothetical protein